MSIALRTLVLGFLVCVPRAFAYPTYIGYGYTNCRSCHFNPLGNGPLTEYGRALSAAEIASHLGVTATDEQMAEQSGFFHRMMRTPSWLALEADYRGNAIFTGLESTPTARWVNMQAEGSVTLRAPNDIVFLTGTLGYVPVPATTPAADRANYPTVISREHYLAIRPSDRWGLYIGFMDVAFGIRVPDHSAFIRSRLGLNMNDQSHGALLNFTGEDWDIALHALMGNALQNPDVRQVGGTLFTEWEVLERVRAGVSLLVTGNFYRLRKMGALHARIGLNPGSSLLFELAFLDELPYGSASTLTDAIFLQSYTRIARGFHLLFTFEHYAQNLNVSGSRLYRAGPGFLWNPWQRLELRTDFLVTRTTNLTTVVQDSYSLMSQVHLWL